MNNWNPTPINPPDALAAGTGAQGVRFWGGTGDDIIFGANDNDKLYGEAGGDVLIGLSEVVRNGVGLRIRHNAANAAIYQEAA